MQPGCAIVAMDFLHRIVGSGRPAAMSAPPEKIGHVGRLLSHTRKERNMRNMRNIG